MNYAERRDRYLRHLHRCGICVHSITVTKEPCQWPLCREIHSNGFISYWTVSFLCPEAIKLLKSICP